MQSGRLDEGDDWLKLPTYLLPKGEAGNKNNRGLINLFSCPGGLEPFSGTSNFANLQHYHILLAIGSVHLL